MSIKSYFLVFIFIIVMVLAGRMTGNFIGDKVLNMNEPQKNIDPLSETPTSPAQPEEEKQISVLVAKQKGTKVREGQGTNTKVIQTLKVGDYVQPLDFSDRWYRVKLSDGRTGWINRKVVELHQLPKEQYDGYFDNSRIDEYEADRRDKLSEELSENFVNLIVPSEADIINVTLTSNPTSKVIAKAYRFDILKFLCYYNNAVKIQLFYGDAGWVNPKNIKIIVKNNDDYLFIDFNMNNIKKLVQRKGKAVQQNISMRIGYSKDFGTMLYIPKGSSFGVLTEYEGWYQIKFNDMIGWVEKNLVKIN